MRVGETPGVATLTGAALGAALDDLARLRIAVFRDWPYLYDGDMDYERTYLARFAAAPGAVLVAARDAGGRIVGAATGAPLAGGDEAFRAPLRTAGFDMETTFYLAESVLDPAFRGRGLGHAFFDAREAHARALGMERAAFCAVMRSHDHPMRPERARDLAPFWRKRGYAPVDGALATFAWTDLGESGESDKRLQFWSRTL